jgi:hypothetical protein
VEDYSLACSASLPDLRVSRKRKGLESRCDIAPRTLKKRKWIAVDE